jgi:hypothetical protein
MRVLKLGRLRAGSARHGGILARKAVGRKDEDPTISAKLDFWNKMRTLWVHN